MIIITNIIINIYNIKQLFDLFNLNENQFCYYNNKIE